MALRDELHRVVQRLAGRSPSAEEERLVALFRNRAELKKELSALDDERHRLLDRLKLQEGSTMRVEEQIATLEDHLGRPEEGYKSLGLFPAQGPVARRLATARAVRAELERQQKDRERRQQIADFDRKRRARLADVDRELVEARVLADQLQAEQKLAQQRMNELDGFWHYFRRRRLAETLETRALRLEAAQIAVTDLSDARHAVESEAPPSFEGVSLEGRRAVNLAIIACAEYLCERLSADGLADLARQTTLRRVYESSYGGREQCLELMERTARALADLERHVDDLVDIKARTDRLRRTAVYRGEKDAIPTQGSVQTPDAGPGAPPRANVLLEEYFDIYGALLR